MFAKEVLWLLFSLYLARCCYAQNEASDDIFRILKQGNSTEVFRQGWTSHEKASVNDWGITPKQEFIDVSERPISKLGELLQGWVDVGVTYKVVVLGPEITSEHVRIASQISGLQTLILDSANCELPNVDQKIDVVQSQRMLIRELWNSTDSLLKVVIEQKGVPRKGYLWEHSYVIVEVSRNRSFHPVIADPIDVDLLRRLSRASTIKHLDLGGTAIADGDLQILSHFPDLETLWLDGTNVTERGLSLVENFRLIRLDISRTLVKGRLPLLPELQILRMNGLVLDDEAQLEEDNLPMLKRIELAGTHLNASFVQSVNRLPRLKEVKCDKQFILLFHDVTFLDN